MFPRMVAAMVAAQIVLLVVCGAGEAAAADCGTATVTPASASMRAAATTAVLCLVNAQRAQRALPPLTASALLTKAAAFHSSDMVRRKYFSHVTPDGQDQHGRVERTGYLRGCRSAVLGETIAWGTATYGSPAELVASLMQSPPHRAVILDRRYRDIGIGLALGSPMGGFSGFGSTLSLNFGRR